MRIKIYEPVYRKKSGKKDVNGNFAHFTVNGARNTNMDTAISDGNRHSYVMDGDAELVRVDVFEMEDWEYYGD
jgi:hypothetical protein